jgi:hypothetical protein
MFLNKVKNFLEAVGFVLKKNMKKIQYTEILKKAFIISWENKFLWSFGFLIFFSLVLENIDLKKESFSGNLADFFRLTENSFYVAGLFLAVLFFFSYVLKILSFGGLISSINNPALYGQRKIKEILIQMVKYFWRLLGLEFLADLAVLILGFVLLMPVASLFSLKAFAFGVIMAILALCIFIPLFILGFLLKKFGAIFITLNDSS